MSSSAITLLDRALPDVIRREWTERVAAPLHRRERGTESVVLFRIGAEWLALSTALVYAIAPVHAMHTIPRRRDSAALGIVNIAGALIVCVSLGTILGVAPRADEAGGESGAARMIIVSAIGGKLAFRVDEMHGVHRFGLDELRPLPATLGNAVLHHTLAILPWRGQSAARLDDALVLHSMALALS